MNNKNRMGYHVRELIFWKLISEYDRSMSLNKTHTGNIK